MSFYNDRKRELIEAKAEFDKAKDSVDKAENDVNKARKTGDAGTIAEAYTALNKADTAFNEAFAKFNAVLDKFWNPKTVREFTDDISSNKLTLEEIKQKFETMTIEDIRLFFKIAERRVSEDVKRICMTVYDKLEEEEEEAEAKAEADAKAAEAST